MIPEEHWAKYEEMKRLGQDPEALKAEAFRLAEGHIPDKYKK